ncbi:hypothetical protein AB2B41_23475, partial [Marimonas sp. MJW-29]
MALSLEKTSFTTPQRIDTHVLATRNCEHIAGTSPNRESPTAVKTGSFDTAHQNTTAMRARSNRNAAQVIPGDASCGQSTKQPEMLPAISEKQTP